jgi:hypothetical protein
MSYHDQAKKINAKFGLRMAEMDDETVTDLINTILWFGQVAKLRCRNNSAYDTFSRECFRELAKLERSDTGLGFEVLHVRES